MAQKSTKPRLQVTLTETRAQALLFELQGDLQRQEQRSHSFAQVILLALECLSKERKLLPKRKATLFPQ